MKVELPEFRRCCLCVPLRYGLLVWGYIKLCLSLAGLIMVSLALFCELNHQHYINYVGIIIQVVCVLLFLTDIGFTVTFLVGAHKKEVKLLNVFYYYSIVDTIGLGISVIFNLILLIVYTVRCNVYGCFFDIFLIIMLSSAFFAAIVSTFLQFYLTMLVRSEIIKLKNNATFRFVNVKKDKTTNEDEEHKNEKEEKVRYDRLQDV